MIYCGTGGFRFAIIDSEEERVDCNRSAASVLDFIIFPRRPIMSSLAQIPIIYQIGNG
jgi:hypothetical protein